MKPLELDANSKHLNEENRTISHVNLRSYDFGSKQFMHAPNKDNGRAKTQGSLGPKNGSKERSKNVQNGQKSYLMKSITKFT